MKQNKKEIKRLSFYIICLIGIALVIQLIYLQCLAPPQLGWWNYYAWRISKGDLLYKDIFCFLQPYYVWIMSFLYQFFGNKLFLYQVVGLVLRSLELTMVFFTLRRFTSDKISFFSTLFGLIITVSYLSDFPLDCNQLIRFYTVGSAFMLIQAISIQSIKKQYIFLALSGFFCGMFLMSKQTAIGLIFFASLGIFLLYFKREGLIAAIKKIAAFILGIVICSLPGYLYLFFTRSFSSYLWCMSNSVSVKGSFLGIFIRIWEYQVHLFEIAVALLLFLWILKVQEVQFKFQKIYTDIVLKEFLYLSVFLLILFRIQHIVEESRGYSISFSHELFLILMYIAYRFICRILNLSPKLKICFKKKLHKLKAKGYYDYLIILISVTFLIGFIIAIYKLDYNLKSDLYYTLGLFNIKRGLVNVIFWCMLLLVLLQTIQFISNQTILGGLTCYIMVAFSMCLCGLSLVSSVIEEIFMLPVAAVFISLLVNRKTDFKIYSNMFLGVIILLTLSITVIQKQVLPYSWHCWNCVGLGRNDISYIDSKVDGLQGYILDADTEKAYETIVDLINENTTSEDQVYEFPFITIFNVLTERSLGTYSPVHYFDVCPDNIAEKDAKSLRNDPPKMVIWCEFGDDLWNFHEDYFRDGNISGQQKIREFYNDCVQKNYKKLYEYQALSVWLLK